MDEYKYSYAGNNPYCYLDSKVLINKLNIHDAAREFFRELGLKAGYR